MVVLYLSIHLLVTFWRIASISINGSVDDQWCDRCQLFPQRVEIRECPEGEQWLGVGRNDKRARRSLLEQRYRLGEPRERRVPFLFFFSSRRRHTRFDCDWSSDVCSSD